MNTANDSNGEMPVLPLPWRDGESALDGATLDRLLRGAPPDDQMSPEAQALAELLAAAGRPAMTSELTGEEAAVAAFVAARRAGIASASPTARRRSVLATLLSSKLAAAAAAGAVSFGGVAAAAYTGALPEPIQDFAHQTVGAPAADNDHAPNSAPPSVTTGQNEPRSDGAVGPDPTGPAMFGLCTAFAEEKAKKGKADARSPAYAALAEAAGGADKIDDFCANVTRPGEPPGPAATPDHPTGPPASVPTAPPTDSPPTPQHPTGPPSAPPTGPPIDPPHT